MNESSVESPNFGRRSILRIWSRRTLGFAGISTLLVVFAFPFLWMIASSLRPRAEIFEYTSPLSWQAFIPLDPTLRNYSTLLSTTNFGRALANSVGISVVTVVLSVYVSALVAFVLSRMHFRGRDFVFVLILSTMLIPFEALMVSMSLVVRDLGLYDTYASLVLPWVADAFIIFLLRQHFLEVPDELQDAARVDGCSFFKLFSRVMLPNIKPALVSAGLIKFLLTWDQYIWPLIVTRSEELEVVNLTIGRLFTSEGIAWEIVFAASALTTLPAIALFLWFQRFYVEGIASTGLKG